MALRQKTIHFFLLLTAWYLFSGFASLQSAQADEMILLEFSTMEHNHKSLKLREKKLKQLTRNPVGQDCPWRLSVAMRPGEVVGHEYLIMSRQECTASNEFAAEIVVADLVPVQEKMTTDELLNYLYVGGTVPAKIRISWGKESTKLLKIVTSNIDSSWLIYCAGKNYSNADIAELKARIEESIKVGQVYHPRATPGTHNCESWIQAMIAPLAELKCFGFTELLRELHDIPDLTHRDSVPH